MNRKLIAAISLAATVAAAPSAASFSLVAAYVDTSAGAPSVKLKPSRISPHRSKPKPTKQTRSGHQSPLISSGIGKSNSRTDLHHKNYHASYYETVDVDADRMSLLSLLDPPSAPLKAINGATATSSRTALRSSPITQLRTIHDYHQNVLSDPNQLCIIRFSAPWCQVCRSTNVSWERMAAKLHKLNGSESNNDSSNKSVKFLSVSLDGKDAATTALKDMLHIDRVPLGIVHHPTQGIYGQKIDLKRSNLSALKKQLERYVSEDDVESGMVLNEL